VHATLARRRRLNREGSAKETMHYEFTWSGATVAFEPGDSFAMVPKNNPAAVRAVLEAASLDGTATVRVGDASQSLHEALMSAKDLHVVPGDLLAALADSAGPGADAIAAGGEAVAAYLADRHLIDVLLEHPGAQLGAQALVDGLRKLKPRLYSVASSPVLGPDEVHFTVETLRYASLGRAREGVATTWLADRVADGDTVPMYCVKANYFRLPEESGVPIIMIGPGTGVAPFRAFLQQRKALGDPGKAWLFFGHQHQKTDFLYEEELQAMQADGTLDELSLAWSRDQAEKIYVQDLIREQGAAVWAWLQDDAHVYVCGDKLSMAPQVRETFIGLAVTHGGLTRAAAEALVTNWETSGQYSVDAY
jgi:sulfite reductase (NADPH) flavoprotein alpha-component